MTRIKRKSWTLLISIVVLVGTVLTASFVTDALTALPADTAPPSNDKNTHALAHSLTNSSRQSHNRSLRVRSSEDSESNKLWYRLPKSVVPEKYFLTIVPIIEPGWEETLGGQWDAPGNVVIDVVAAKATKTITLHSKNITIHHIGVTHGSEEVHVRNYTFHEGRRSFLIIHLSQYLIPGDAYKININFTSHVSQTLNGLFRSSYKNPDTGKLEWFAATHMEALHARQMFPCFDEPSYKATIQAKIGRRDDYVALFNTESIKNETMEGVQGWVWETFAPTVPMCTYLTAMVVAKFEFSEAPGKLLPQTRVRTYAPPHYVRQGAAKYPSEVAESILSTYGDYFKEKYPMRKLDSVAVPSFLYGAMENYGLPIFRETLLLHFENQSTESQRYIVTMVIAHELGHQWFGNLVSPDWWTHLWLSEGLTKFTEYIGLNATIPEFKPWDMFILESLQLGLKLDADSRTSHSLKIDEDAWLMRNEMEWFDDIAYKKGGSLLRMMQGFLTEPVLRKGLSRYLSRMKYKAAVQDDLFSDCDKEGQVAHKLPENTTLQQVMSAWTLQSGFPLLRVSLTRNGDAIKVTQEKYSSSRGNNDSKKFKWFIPVSVATSKNPSFDPEPEFWMRDNETSVRISLPTNSWIILNAGTTGFYRVIYDEDLTNRITDQLMDYPMNIQHLARSQLIDDYLNAALNRYIPIKRALNLTLYMKTHAETEHVVWNTLLSTLKTAFRLFKDTEEDFKSLKEYMLPRLEKALQGTGGYSAVDMNTKGIPVIRHAQLLDWACNLESQGCIKYATGLVKSWKETGQLKIPRDFRNLVLSSAVANDETGEIFDFILDRYRNGTMVDGKLKSHLLSALGSTRDHEKIKRLVDGSMQDGFLNDKSDAVSLLENLAMNHLAVDLILQKFKDNFDEIVKYFGGANPIVQVSNSMAPHLKSLGGLFLIEQLVQANEHVLQTALSAAISRIRANIIWYDDFGEHMLEFFEQNK